MFNFIALNAYVAREVNHPILFYAILAVVFFYNPKTKLKMMKDDER